MDYAAVVERDGEEFILVESVSLVSDWRLVCVALHYVSNCNQERSPLREEVRSAASLHHLS